MIIQPATEVQKVVLKQLGLCRDHTSCIQSGARSMARSSRYFPNHPLDEKVICNNAEPWKAVALIAIWQESLVLCMIAAQYFSGAQPVAVINDAELAR